MKREEIFVFGAGGHAKVIIDLIEETRRYSISFLLDDNHSLAGTSLFGYVVRGGMECVERPDFAPRRCAVAIGNNRDRRRVAALLLASGCQLVTATHPRAVLGRGVALGRGTIIFPGAVVNADTQIGENVIVNTGAQVDHDCSVGDGSHLAPGSVLCGGVQVGEECLIGAAAVVLPGRRVGRGACVGAGAVVLEDVAEDSIVVGNPAKALEK